MATAFADVSLIARLILAACLRVWLGASSWRASAKLWLADFGVVVLDLRV